MKFNCGACHKSYTTVTMSEKDKIAFYIFALKCPNCGAQNISGQEYPLITLAEECRSHIGSIDSMYAHCEGCSSRFICHSGVENEAEQKPIEKISEAQRVKYIERKNAEYAFREAKDNLRKMYCHFWTLDNKYYFRFMGTTWKLNKADVDCLTNNTWETKTLQIIKAGLQRHSFSIEKVAQNVKQFIKPWEIMNVDY